MKIFSACCLVIILALMMVTTSCTSFKTVNVWKAEGNNERIRKVLVIAVGELDFMQKHFEDVLSERLSSRGIEAIPSHKVFPKSKGKIDREVVAAKVRELGIGSVLVARPVGKEESSQINRGGVYEVPAAYSHGWYGFYSDSFALPSISGTEYDAEFITIVTNIYQVRNEKLVWSSLSRVKVENSRQGAINPLIDLLMRQLEDSNVI